MKRVLFAALLLLTLSACMGDSGEATQNANGPGVTTQNASVTADCQVSEWSQWKDDMTSSCSSGMHMSSQTRLRTVLRQPDSSGAACPALSETREVHVMCESATAVKIPLPPRGTEVYSTLRVADTQETVGKRADMYGQFRSACAYSHMAYDDPIVFSGSPGASHLHVFFGNTTTNANSTQESLDAGSSTCRGGTANRSAYWVPAIIDTGLNQAVVPDYTLTYYKDNGMSPAGGPLTTIPNGLRMIAGNPVTFGRQITWEGHPNLNELHHSFECLSDKLPDGRGGRSQSIPPCPVGGEILFELAFPQCWDGKNLDSPDHRSHMSYREGWMPGHCDAAHPVALPAISFNIHIRVKEGNDTTKWRLSSDAYDTSKPGGYSAHGDVIVDWDEDVKKAWFEGCIMNGADCHAHMIGNNRMLY